MDLLPPALQLGRLAMLIGLVFGVVYSVGGCFADLFTTGLNAGTAMAFGALIGMPLLFGALGFICGALGGVLSSALRGEGPQ